MDLTLKRHLFYETSHSPSLVEMVGHKAAKRIINFCYIANPYYPTPAMMRDLAKNLPLLIKSYPSSQPRLSQEHLAKVLHLDPARLIIGNGASELIAFIEETLIKNIGIPVPTFSEYLEKLRSHRAAHLYWLDPKKDYQLDLDAYLPWIEEEGLSSALVINPGNPTGQFIPLKQMLRFLEHARKLSLVIVDESFIDFAGDPVPSLLAHSDDFENLLIVRSMSKHCGVPGLRLGYCYTANERIPKTPSPGDPGMEHQQPGRILLEPPPAHGSRLSRGPAAAHRGDALARGAAREDSWFPRLSHRGEFRADADRERRETAAELQMQLLERFHIYVRDCSNKVGMDDRHIRVASQGRAKDIKLVRALKVLARGRDQKSRSRRRTSRKRRRK
jgi:histidinol-phosphate/aromatic aminotransferase/cobyric acid decarboxylase-like protein